MLASADQPVKLALPGFPRLVHDSACLLDKLQPLLHDISFGRFDPAYRHLAQPGLVHGFAAEPSPARAARPMQHLHCRLGGKGKSDPLMAA